MLPVFVNALLRSWGKRTTAVRIEGACLMTGNCCRNLILVDDGKPVKTARQFRRLQRKQRSFQMFEPNDEPSPDGSLRFRCSNLRADSRCGIYETRPDICRVYPQVEMFAKGGSLLAGCGYRLVRQSRKAAFDRVFAAELRSNLEANLERDIEPR